MKARSLILFVALAGGSWQYDYSIELPGESYSIGEKEDPHGRINYEVRLLADPASGRIPLNIRQAELDFEARLVSAPTYKPLEASRVSQATWRGSGPFNVGGRTRAVAFDISDPNVLVAAGVSGGVWKSTNQGTSWRRVSDPELLNSITCIHQDHRAGRTTNWYYGSGELVGGSPRAVDAPYRGDGVFKSEDSGETWISVGSTGSSDPTTFNKQFQYIWNILINHQKTSVDELWVAAFGGILKSPDGGATWQGVITPSLLDLPDTTNLNNVTASFYTNIVQTDEGHFYAALSNFSRDGKAVTESGFYFSEDGSSWFPIVPPGLPEGHERTIITFAPSDNRIVYFLTKGSNTTVTLNKYRLNAVSPAGEPSGNWQDLSDNLPEPGDDLGEFDTQSNYNMMMTVNPTDPDVVYIGATNLYRSSNGFSSPSGTKWIGGYKPGGSANLYPNHHPDQHLALFYPNDSRKMLSANDGGLHFTNDATADSVSWTAINNGFVTTQFYTIAQQQDESTLRMTGGMQDNGSWIRDAPGENPSWARLLGGDGSYSAIASKASFVYASFQYSQIYRLTINSKNQLTSFARVDPAGVGEQEDGEETYLFSNPFVLDPANSNRMFLIGVDELWRNDNLAQIAASSQNKATVNWNAIPDTRFSEGAYTAIHKTFSGDILYAGVYLGDSIPQLVKVENASVPGLESVTKISQAVFPTGGYLISIASNPIDSDEVLVVFSNYGVRSIFHSLDGGATFTHVGGNLEEFPDGTGNGPSIRWAEIVPTQSGARYYVGTSVGLFSTESLSDGTMWIKESSEKIGKSVVVMLNYRPIDGRMIIATHGNGAFDAYISDFRQVESPIVTSGYAVDPSFPNPFRDLTFIRYSIPENDVVAVNLYDASGRLVKNLLYGPQFAGVNTVSWDGTNVAGVPVRQGIYFCSVSYRNRTKTQRVVYAP